MTESVDYPNRLFSNKATTEGKLDILIEQVGRLTEAVHVGFGDLNAKLERIALTAEVQAQGIDRLISMLENKE